MCVSLLDNVTGAAVPCLEAIYDDLLVSCLEADVPKYKEAVLQLIKRLVVLGRLEEAFDNILHTRQELLNKP
jgi:hypothetical protein